jgi:hypothetical protein
MGWDDFCAAADARAQLIRTSSAAIIDGMCCADFFFTTTRIRPAPIF